ncbi:hypothetical protein ABBQ32_013691 [Trebouxia sp. C0010 RCD-2024]
MLRLVHRAVRSVGRGRVTRPFEAACAARSQHSDVCTDAKSQAAKQWTPVVDPFTSAMQSKAEKELLDQVLRQAEEQEQAEDAAEQERVRQRGEHGGPKGQEPTRFGDWEKGGRCYDF